MGELTTCLVGIDLLNEKRSGNGAFAYRLIGRTPDFAS